LDVGFAFYGSNESSSLEANLIE